MNNVQEAKIVLDWAKEKRDAIKKGFGVTQSKEYNEADAEYIKVKRMFDIKCKNWITTNSIKH